MLNFFKSYPYFNLSILLLFMVFIIFLFSSRNRSYILFSGILSVPFAFSSLLFIPEYWDPVRIMGTVISIEDVIFSFSTGCMACWITTLLKKKKITFDFAPILILKRYLIISHFCFLLTIVLNSAGMGIMTANYYCNFPAWLSFFIFFLGFSNSYIDWSCFVFTTLRSCTVYSSVTFSTFQYAMVTNESDRNSIIRFSG